MTTECWVCDDTPELCRCPNRPPPQLDILLIHPDP